MKVEAKKPEIFSDAGPLFDSRPKPARARARTQANDAVQYHHRASVVALHREQPTSLSRREKMSTLEQATTAIIKAEPKPHQFIYRQDWQKFMAASEKNSMDLILTDPPYTISRKTGFASPSKNGVARLAVSMDFGKWDKKQIDLPALCCESYRTLRRGGTAIIFYDLWKISHLETAMREAGFKMIRLIIWQKTNPVPLNQSATYLSNSREIAVVGVKGGKPTFNGKYDNGIYSYPIPRHNGQRVHPTQKPLDLFRALVRKHSVASDMIVDPFLGSGTTAVAAIQEGRKFTGCEIDPEYVKQAKLRVSNLETV